MVSTSQLRVCYRFSTGLRPVPPVRDRIRFASTVDAQSPTHALKLLEPKLIFLNLTVLLRIKPYSNQPYSNQPYSNQPVVATADLLQLREVLARDINLDLDKE